MLAIISYTSKDNKRKKWGGYYTSKNEKAYIVFKDFYKQIKDCKFINGVEIR